MYLTHVFRKFRFESFNKRLYVVVVMRAEIVCKKKNKKICIYTNENTVSIGRVPNK